MSLSKHIKFDAEVLPNDTAILNLFVPNGGVPQDCTILVIDLLEIEALIQMCRVSKYLHACVRQSTKRDSMAVKCRLKWLRVTVGSILTPRTSKELIKVTKTDGVFPLTVTYGTSDNYNPVTVAYVALYIFASRHQDESGSLAWRSRIPTQIVYGPLVYLHLHQYISNYLDETVFTVLKKHCPPPHYRSFDILKIRFEYGDGLCDSYAMIKKPRTKKDFYRVSIRLDVHTPKESYETVDTECLVSDFIFDIEDIVGEGKAWLKLNDPEWLKTRPLKFRKDWWSDISQEEEESDSSSWEESEEEEDTNLNL